MSESDYIVEIAPKKTILHLDSISLFFDVTELNRSLPYGRRPIGLATYIYYTDLDEEEILFDAIEEVENDDTIYDSIYEKIEPKIESESTKFFRGLMGH